MNGLWPLRRAPTLWHIATPMAGAVHSIKASLSLCRNEVAHWSMTTLREKPIKIDAWVARHGRYVTFQLAEIANRRRLFADIPRLIDGLRPQPAPA